MNKIEIVFTKSKKKFAIGSWIIRLWTRKPYSHVARSLVTSQGVKLYYQANEGKVNYECEEVFNRKHTIIKTYTIAVNPILDSIIRKECSLNAGQPYGTCQNIGIALVDICRFFGKILRNPFKKGQNCSELLYRHIFKIICPKLDYNPDTIKPHEIEDIIHTHFEEKSGIWIHKQD